MHKTLAIAKRIWSQFAHDPRTLALLFVAPIVVVWLLSTLLVSDTYRPKIATVGLPAGFEQALESQDAHVTATTQHEARRLLAGDEVDAVLSLEPGTTTLKVLCEGTNMTKNQAVSKAVADAMSDFSATSRDELKTYVDQKKEEIEQKKADLERKRDEMRQTIDQAKAKAEEQRSEAQDRLRKIRSQLKALKTSMASLRTSLSELQQALAPLAAANPEVAQTLQSLAASIPSSLGALPINPDNLKLDSSSIEGLMSGVDLDSLDLKGLDTDFDLNIDTFMPIQSVETDFYHGSSSWEMFDFYGPVFIPLFLFIFVFITCSFSLVNERISGTLTRFLATPVRSTQVLAGYVMGFGVISLIQAAIILTFGLKVIGFPNEGNIWLVVFIGLSLAIASVTLGLLVSGLATKAFQVIQLMLMFVTPQILLCGLFDLSASPAWMRVVSDCLPLTYGVRAMQNVMLAGAGLETVGRDLIVIWGFIVAFFLLAAVRFKKKRAKAHS